jgi:excinuclease ABC subunit A
VLYVLDEPSIGLHQRDNERLLVTLRRLRDLGNSVLVVEHDEDAIRTADWLVDIGPGAGAAGGHVVSQGTPAEVMDDPPPDRRLPLTAAADRRPAAAPQGDKASAARVGRPRQQPEDVSADPARHLHLRHRRLRRQASPPSTPSTPRRPRLMAPASSPARRAIDGLEHLDKVIDIDQSPIGRTPALQPRHLHRRLHPDPRLVRRPPESQARGYKPGRFSFNVKGRPLRGLLGRRPHQDRDALPARRLRHLRRCKGKRYNRETLEVKFRGKSIADVLDMTVWRGASSFSPCRHPRRSAHVEECRVAAAYRPPNGTSECVGRTLFDSVRRFHLPSAAAHASSSSAIAGNSRLSAAHQPPQALFI